MTPEEREGPAVQPLSWSPPWEAKRPGEGREMPQGRQVSAPSRGLVMVLASCLPPCSEAPSCSIYISCEEFLSELIKRRGGAGFFFGGGGTDTILALELSTLASEERMTKGYMNLLTPLPW